MMVGVLDPGLVAVLCAILAAAGLARPLDRHRYDVPGAAPHGGGDDATARSERSTNLSHITGTARKIQMYVKNRHLQILPDGTVNGTADDSAGRIDYTILQRSSVHTGQLKIQSVATCLFLCMDSCGLLYGSREFTEDCVFSEMIEQHHYNTYSSARYSNDKRTLYLALNKRGQPRKVQVRKGAALGKLSTYTKVLTRVVPAERVEALAAALLRARGSPVLAPQHAVRHHGYHQLCPQPPPPAASAAPGDPPPEEGRDKFRCRRRKKRKKKKRRCRVGEEEGEQCQRRPAAAASPARKKDQRRCADSDDQQECLRRLQAARKRRKNGKKAADPEGRVKKKTKKNKAKRKRQKRPKEANNGGGKLEQAEENQREVSSSSTTTMEDSWWDGDATAATSSAIEDAASATEEDVDYPSSSPPPAPD